MEAEKGPSPREDAELEDGEICDDESEERAPVRRGGGAGRPGRGARVRRGKPHQHPHMGHPPYMPYGRPHGPFPPVPRQPCGARGSERAPAPSPCPLLPLPPPPVPPPIPGFGPHGDPCPRTSGFWERSHGALGRFRHRAMPNSGQGGWTRGPRGGGDVRGPPGRYGPGDMQGNRKRILPEICPG